MLPASTSSTDAGDVYVDAEDLHDIDDYCEDWEDDDVSHATPSANAALLSELRKWVGEHNITLRALTALLAILRSNFNDGTIPKDARTVMRTPTTLAVTQLNEEGAEYWHQGLDSCLRGQFHNLCAPETISLNINIDGLPLFNSATKCFWPILANVQEHPEIAPMAIGVFYGETKPDNAEIFFRPFVNECKEMLQNGLTINEYKLTLKIRCFICDSPARAFVKGKMQI